MNLTSLQYEVLKETKKTISVRVLSATYSGLGRNVAGLRCGRPTDYDLVEGRATTHYKTGSPMSYSMMTKFLKDDRQSVKFRIIRELGAYDKIIYLKWGN